MSDGLCQTLTIKEVDKNPERARLPMDHRGSAARTVNVAVKHATLTNVERFASFASHARHGRSAMVITVRQISRTCHAGFLVHIRPGM